jgi:hypothetical protein
LIAEFGDGEGGVVETAGLGRKFAARMVERSRSWQKAGFANVD